MNDDIFPFSHFISARSKKLKLRVFVSMWHGINGSPDPPLCQHYDRPCQPLPAAVLWPGPHMATPIGRRPTVLPLCLWQEYVPVEKHGFHPITGPFTMCKHSALSLLSSQQPMLFPFAFSQTVGTAKLTGLGYKHPNWICSETDIVLRAYFQDCHGCCTFTWPTLPSWSHHLTS